MTKHHIDYEKESRERFWWLNKTGGSAHDSLTVMDAFAISVMPIAAEEWRWAGKDSDDKRFSKLAKLTYDLAEAMMKERTKRESNDA